MPDNDSEQKIREDLSSIEKEQSFLVGEIFKANQITLEDKKKLMDFKGKIDTIRDRISGLGEGVTELSEEYFQKMQSLVVEAEDKLQVLEESNRQMLAASSQDIQKMNATKEKSDQALEYKKMSERLDDLMAIINHANQTKEISKNEEQLLESIYNLKEAFNLVLNKSFISEKLGVDDKEYLYGLQERIVRLQKEINQTRPVHQAQFLAELNVLRSLHTVLQYVHNDGSLKDMHNELNKKVKTVETNIKQLMDKKNWGDKDVLQVNALKQTLKDIQIQQEHLEAAKLINPKYGDFAKKNPLAKTNDSRSKLDKLAKRQKSSFLSSFARIFVREPALKKASKKKNVKPAADAISMSTPLPVASGPQKIKNKKNKKEIRKMRDQHIPIDFSSSTRKKTR